MIHYIYALHWTNNNRKEYFYVGRSIHPTIRLQEHHYAKKTGHELKYQFIRALEGCGNKWDMEIIAEVKEQDEDFEDFYCWKLLNEGHPLQNQKAGDAFMPDATACYTSPQEYVLAREKHLEMVKNKPVVTKVKRESTGEYLTRFVDDVKVEKECSALQEIRNRIAQSKKRC